MRSATSGSGAKVIPLRPADRGEVPASDELLLAACGRGDRQALGELYERHHTAVFRYVTRFIRASQAEADDLVQLTFLEVWRAAERFTGASAVRSFILGIAANVARHHVRGEGRRRAAHVASGGERPQSAPIADHGTHRREQVQRLGAALAQLSEELRETFLLVELEEIPGVEAARILGVREGTVWRRLHDARKRLRAALEVE
jgi:RNA polymerase sigma-70 factor (ECF subfamily)